MLSNLVSVSKKGVLALYSGQAIKFIFQILSIIVLARLLSPKDYGLTALALSILAIGEVFRDSGLSTAAIQSKEVSHLEKSNLFWVSSSIGLFLFLMLFFFSGSVADFYNEHELESILKTVGLCFLINGIAAQYKVGINRNLQFKSIAIGEVASYVISVSVAIWMAANGFEYWAIIYQQVTQSSLLLMTYIYFYRWLPSLPDFNTSIKKYVNFGIDLVAIQVISQTTRSLDTFIIGSQFGSDALGFYNRAQQIVKMAYLQLVTPSTTIALPVLSKLKDNINEYYRFVNFGQSALVHIIFMVFSLTCINAEWIVLTLLGREWQASVDLLRLLSFGALFQAMQYSHYWIFLSKALTRQRLAFSMMMIPVYVVFIYYGSTYSVEMVAVGLILALLSQWLLSLRFLKANDVLIDRILTSLGPICSSYFIALMVSIFIQDTEYWSGLVELIIVNAAFLLCITICGLVSTKFTETAKSIFKLKSI